MVHQKNDTIISPAGNKTIYISYFGPVCFNEQRYTETVQTVQCEILTTESIEMQGLQSSS